ncbi:MAG: sigma-70 family RNA polymerase sigma factor [Planctomycetes bacterium]|nr:sigma-70 family RNA polymerase sigma factor [Planctomycetota bacterium]
MDDRLPAPTARAFVDRHLQSVWRYLRMHGASPSEADDLAQEAFVTALRKGALELEPAAGWTFLRRAARFAFLHHLRDRKRDPALADAVDELWDRDAEHDGGGELVDALQRCVEQLQGRPRLAVRRCYGLDGDPPCDRDEVARSLELQPNGLKTLLQRTRAALRECIERTVR